MKKSRILLVAVMGLMLVGCSGNSESAKENYDSAEEIVNDDDKFFEGGAVLKKTDDGYSYKASKFNGRETVWHGKLDEDQDVEVECSLTLEEGTAKIVCVDAQDNITTLVECTPETSSDGNITTTVPMTSGTNSIKIIGYDCKKVNLELNFEI